MLKAVLVQGLLVANVVLANEVKLVLFRLLHRELFTLTPTLPIHSHFLLFSLRPNANQRGDRHILSVKSEEIVSCNFSASL